MNCEDCRASMPDLWSGTLPESGRALIEMHLASCTACRAEASHLGGVWQGLKSIPNEEPSRALRTGFYEKLDAWGQGYAEAATVNARPTLFSFWKSWWSANPAFRAGLAVASLALAFAAGFAINNKREGGQLAQLRTEVVNMRQLVALSLLQQQSASDRLKGVNYAVRLEQPDTEVLAALLYTVNHDQNMNVRLAAIDAIRTYADSPVASARTAASHRQAAIAISADRAHRSDRGTPGPYRPSGSTGLGQGCQGRRRSPPARPMGSGEDAMRVPFLAAPSACPGLRRCGRPDIGNQDVSGGPSGDAG